MNYSAGVIPVTKADKTVDVADKTYEPANAADRLNWESCKLDRYALALLSSFSPLWFTSSPWLSTLLYTRHPLPFLLSVPLFLGVRVEKKDGGWARTG